MDPRDINYIIIHHSATPRRLRVEIAESSFNRSHKARNWGSVPEPIFASPSSLGSYIQYHYVIYGNGDVRQYRKLSEVGWHASNWEINNGSIGICLSGNFDKELPSELQVLALTKLLEELVNTFKIDKSNVLPHRRFARKSCPGRNLSDTWAQNLL